VAAFQLARAPGPVSMHWLPSSEPGHIDPDKMIAVMCQGVARYLFSLNE